MAACAFQFQSLHSKTLFGRQTHLSKSPRPPLAKNPYLSIRGGLKQQWGITEGLKGRGICVFESKCVKARTVVNSLPEWNEGSTVDLNRSWNERVMRDLMDVEVTPLEVSKWAAIAGIAIWAVKAIMGALLNPYFWTYASWFFIIWPYPTAVAIGAVTLYYTYKKIKGEKMTAWEQTLPIEGALMWTIIVPIAHRNGYIEGWPLMLFFVYSAFFLTGHYIRMFKYGESQNDPSIRSPPASIKSPLPKKKQLKSSNLPKIAQIAFVVCVVGAHLAATYESPLLLMIPGGLISNALPLILLLWALQLQYNAIWYLDKYSDIRLVEPYAVVVFGPYRWIRHPIYASCMFLFAGYCIALRAYRCLAFIVLVSFLYYELKSRLEEDALVEAFGERYKSYRNTVKYKYIPFVY